LSSALGGEGRFGKRIVGGTMAPADVASYTVAFVTKNAQPPAEGYLCSGSLIDSDFVLTAASCFRDIFSAPGQNIDYNENQIDAILNHPNLSANAPANRRYTIDRVHINPTYTASQGPTNDLAIVELNGSPLNSGATTVYIARPANPAFESAGINAVISGWGITTADSFSGAYSEYLLQTSVPIVDTITCQASSPLFTITDKYLCAGITGRTSCIGDEGAPLVYTYTQNGQSYKIQVGIAAYQSSIAQPRCDGTYGIYTRVSPLDAWIESVTGALPRIPNTPTTGAPIATTTGNIQISTTGALGNTTTPNSSSSIVVSYFLIALLSFLFLF
jgi:secreted trypsin-like serine protease